MQPPDYHTSYDETFNLLCMNDMINGYLKLNKKIKYNKYITITLAISSFQVKIFNLNNSSKPTTFINIHIFVASYIFKK